MVEERYWLVAIKEDRNKTVLLDCNLVSHSDTLQGCDLAAVMQSISTLRASLSPNDLAHSTVEIARYLTTGSAHEQYKQVATFSL